MKSRPWLLPAILLVLSAAISPRALAQSDAASPPVSSNPPPLTTSAEQSVALTAPVAPQAVAPPASTTDAGPSSAAVTTTQAQQALDVLQNADKRRELVQTLQTIAKLEPLAVQPAKKAVALATAAALVPAAGTVAAVKSPAVTHLAPHSLGADILTEVTRLFNDIGTEASKSISALTRFSSITDWAHGNLSDPEARHNLLTGSAKFALVILCGFATEWLILRLMKRPLLALRRSPAQIDVEEDALLEEDTRQKPAATDRNRRVTGAWRLLRRLPWVIAALILDALPAAGFAVSAYLVASTDAFSSSPSASSAILAIVNAYVLARLMMCIVRALLSPESSHLRLIGLRTETALYLEKWLRRILWVAIFGGAVTEVAGFYGLDDNAHDALLKIVALVDHIFLVVIVIQCRRPVAVAIAATPEATGTVAAIRNGLAATWHYIAIFYIVALWIVWAIEVKHGISKLVHFFFTTVAVLLAARLVSILALGLLERALRGGAGIVKNVPGFDGRAERYHALLRDIVWSVICVLTAIILLEVWGIDAFAWFSKSKIGARLLGAAVTIGVSVAFAIFAWEILTGALERHLIRLGDDGQFTRAARLRTLAPMLRTTLMVTLVIILGMTILSEIGVNIAPLLAGAGIVGVAVGFGSQKLVQDLITGIFLLLENAMQVGDQVSVAGLSGAVEHLSIRTIRLRAGDGSVHIIPFSSVTTVTNTNRGVGNAAVSVNVSYEEDTDSVGEVLKQIATEMRRDQPYDTMMTSDLQLWGVDKVDASMVTIVGQIACTDSGRWGVQREFNRRMKIRFQELGIAIANPTQTVLLKNASDEYDAPVVPNLPKPKIDEFSPANVKESPPPSALSNKD